MTRNHLTKSFCGMACLAMAALLMMMNSCESVDLDEYLSGAEEDGYKVTFRVDSYNITSFETDGSYSSSKTRSLVGADQLGTVLNFAVYQDGEKQKQVNQSSSDDDFGTVTVSLPEGNYEFAVIIHSCNGNATMTSTEKVTFPSNKVTDTFTYYGNISITEDMTCDITVSRRVAMYRMTVESIIPDDVEQMKFYYTGGSSTLNLETGFGCVDSRQTEIRDVLSRESGQIFEVYTFPHNTTDELKMVVSALDASGDTYRTSTYEGVPIEVNKITNHSCDFFSGTASGSSSRQSLLSIQGNNAWEGELSY